MNALIWQTVLLLAVAYLAGAMIACLIRRTMFTERAPVAAGSGTATLAPESSEPAPPPVQVEEASVEVRSAPPPEAPPPPAPVTPRVNPTADLPEGNVARFERALSGTPQPEAPPRPPPSAERSEPDSGSAAAAATAAAAAAAVAARMASQEEPPTSAEPTPVAPAPAVAAEAPDDLKRIQGIDDEVVAMLGGLGVDRFAEIASWSAADVADVNEALGARRRVEQQNWIEQAHILAQGRETAYSERLAAGIADVTVRPNDIAAPSPRVMVRTDQPARAPQVEPPPLPQQSAPSPQVAPSPGDDVISPEVHKRAAFSQSTSSAQEVPAGARPSSPPPVAPGEQEPEGDEPAPSASAAARPARLFEAIRQNKERQGALRSGRNDVSGLRSVRSEALRRSEGEAGGDARRQVGGQVVRSATPDDLKRIRGVGVLIEKRLNALGVTSYDQIANWTHADVLRVSQQLDFKGRVERENWIEQARILAAGGQTEFSRRVDRGEVESNPRSEPQDD